MEELDQKRRLAEEEVSQLQSRIQAAQKERQEAATCKRSTETYSRIGDKGH